MQFMMMMKAHPDYEKGKMPDPRLIAAINQHAEELTRQGILVGTGGLLPSHSGAKIKVTNSRMAVTDGPFAETKELIGGYAILNVSSKAEAIRLGREFLQIHLDILGPAYEGEMEIRQMFGPEGCASVREEEAVAVEHS